MEVEGILHITSLPITYYGEVIGEAITNEEFKSLAELTWRIEVPRNVRRLGQNRPDVILGLLREEESYRERCRAHTNVTRGLTVRLSHIVLRPEILIPLQKWNRGEKHAEILEFIRARSMSVKRAVCLNGNRLDCRVSNLREVTSV